MLTKKENIKNEVKSSKNAKSPSPMTTTAHSSQTSCCQPQTHKAAVSPPAKTSHSHPMKQPEESSMDKKTASKTHVTVKYDAGYPNQLYIRGKGANLSWEKGQPLKNIKADEWVWETESPFTNCEFKILINDRIYENGDNHHLNAGSNLLYAPHFY